MPYKQHDVFIQLKIVWQQISLKYLLASHIKGDQSTLENAF